VDDVRQWRGISGEVLYLCGSGMCRWWGDGLMRSHGEMEITDKFFFGSSIECPLLCTLLPSPKPREFVMEHPTYGNTLGSSASQPMSGPDLLFPCRLLRLNFPSPAHPSPTNQPRGLACQPSRRQTRIQIMSRNLHNVKLPRTPPAM